MKNEPKKDLINTDELVNRTTRRQFVKQAGALPVLAKASALGAGMAVTRGSYAKTQRYQQRPIGGSGAYDLKGAFTPVPLSENDKVDVASGFESYVLAKMGDRINKKGDLFGDCCDYTAFIPGNRDSQAFLWVNHEYIHTSILYGKNLKGKDKSKKQVDYERSLVGGSFLELNFSQGKYELNAESELAFRIDGTTPIPMVGAAGGKTATGTMGNCSGGVTPWGTILTAEENVSDFYDRENRYYYGWAEHYTMPPENYGYIVEIDPKTKTARKLTSLGRFAHEGATIQKATSGHVVAYMGDDARFQCLYKFVSKEKVTGNPEADKDLLLDGTLFVANLEKGRWEKLTPDHPKLKADKLGRFKSLRDICVNTREAAHLAGGTPLNRPEGIAVDAKAGTVFVALTNNSKSGDFHGSILAVYEKGVDHSGSEFSSETVLTGGPKAGISCPDNLVMGPGGYLWAGMDISSSSMGSGVYKAFPRNAFHRIEPDREGNLHARRLLLAPFGAEVTGPSFSDSNKDLFLSIQHPGEGLLKNSKMKSSWPLGRGKPLSSVIVVKSISAKFS